MHAPPGLVIPAECEPDAWSSRFRCYKAGEVPPPSRPRVECRACDPQIDSDHQGPGWPPSHDVRSSPDSPLEGNGFELPVPRRVSFVKPRYPLRIGRSRRRTARPLSVVGGRRVWDLGRVTPSHVTHP